jgi:hypothetical protein
VLFVIIYLHCAVRYPFAPRWYLVGCAVYDVGLAALCYVPLLKRH